MRVWGRGLESENVEALSVAEFKKYFMEVMPEVSSNKDHSHHMGSGISSSDFFKDFTPSIICSPPSPAHPLLLWSNQGLRWSITTMSETESKNKTLIHLLVTVQPRVKEEHLLPNIPFFPQRTVRARGRWRQSRGVWGGEWEGGQGGSSHC